MTRARLVMSIIAILVTAVALIAAAWFQRYIDDAGIIWNLIHGRIYLTDSNSLLACADARNSGNSLDAWFVCGAAIPLAYILSSSLLLASIVGWLLWRSEREKIKVIFLRLPLKLITICLGLGIGVGASLFFYRHITRGTFEECMISEMKGQQQTMVGYVSRVCSRRFNREIEIPIDALKIEFRVYGAPTSPSMPDLYQQIYVSVQKSNNYLPSRGTFHFSGKQCRDASGNNFNIERTLNYEPQNGGFTFQYRGDELLQCMRTDAIWGYYR